MASGQERQDLVSSGEDVSGKRVLLAPAPTSDCNGIPEQQLDIGGIGAIDGVDLELQKGQPLNNKTTTFKVATGRPLILITDPNNDSRQQAARGDSEESTNSQRVNDGTILSNKHARKRGSKDSQVSLNIDNKDQDEEGENYEVVDGIRYRIVAAVTKPAGGKRADMSGIDKHRISQVETRNTNHHQQQQQSNIHSKLNSMRRKSSAFVSSLLNAATSNNTSENNAIKPPRRLSIYEMTKSPPPETSLEIYFSERRRSSTVSSKQFQQQIQEQQSTFETNYCQRQQYFKDLNQKLINQDKKLLNVVANRGHRHSVDIAQLPLHLAQAKAASSAAAGVGKRLLANNQSVVGRGRKRGGARGWSGQDQQDKSLQIDASCVGGELNFNPNAINQIEELKTDDLKRAQLPVEGIQDDYYDEEEEEEEEEESNRVLEKRALDDVHVGAGNKLVPIRENKSLFGK